MAAAEGIAGAPDFVLSIDTVRWAIGELTSRRTHPHFPAYLEIRRAAGASGRLDDLQPRWVDLRPMYETPGGPPTKPNYRPFWEQASATAHYWMGSNLAGSYAPSSLRGSLEGIADISPDGKYTLLPSHWEVARENLLYDEPMPVVTLASFTYRNYGFSTDGPSLGPIDLIDAFRRHLGFETTRDHLEFDRLYNASIPDRTDWFEPFDPDLAPIPSSEA